MMKTHAVLLVASIEGGPRRARAGHSGEPAIPPRRSS